jgi:small secreted domain DUF320
MHGFAKRGLALAAATSGLVLATAGIAAADATAMGSTSNNPGVGSGNTANIAGSVPVNACGNQALLIALKDADAPQMCKIEDSTNATATGSSSWSPGVVAGNVADAALSVPVNACGNQVGVISAASVAAGSKCKISGGSATATGSSVRSGGVVSGNVVNAALSVPVNACGNQVDVIGFADMVDGSRCGIG